MSNTIKTRLVKIGNSQGIRIPKVLLDQIGLTKDLEMEVQGDRLILRAARKPRQGWAEQFREMAAQSDDILLDLHTHQTSTWDEEEWTWE
ncbi:AbrB/MazE/SpoVT family DNA-binding domain-containing protein [Candidatus Chloroploca asiatica]|uniref:MazE family transcriptional regulator n=1 Tax=Candidatus Chloroploca asiatica TaxID=1506545 RepID=A0A2H3KLG8_9CHLR|nr:AbrB/MazE/SpoVT family DNA-binding domain-containing protein [Candidatus Chloroploca asiatica]PDV98825.1 MazE family transcriptional regulator [Candidatus Chloroploca asiatica]